MALCLSLVLILFIFKPEAQSRTKAYYSGEAINYDNGLVFATTNTGALELFILDSGEIVRTAMFKPKFVSLPKGSDSYHDLEFDIVNDRLYLYLTDGRYLYKFDVSNPFSPKLLEKLKDNSWDWFMKIESTDDHLVTVGTNDIKFWNRDLQVVSTHKIEHDKIENISFSRDGKYIFSLVDNVLNVYETKDRKVSTRIWLEAKEANIKGVYYDISNKEIFITDDEALKVFSPSGKLLRSFEHTSDFGFDVAPSNLDNTVYFSDGIGIVKSDKRTLKALDWEYTTSYTKGRSWTTDIEVVSDPSGDKVVAFNNSEIIVMDKDLGLIDLFRASAVDEAPIEKLYLKLDKTQAFAGEHLTVSGGGFSPNEELTISMGKDKWAAASDANGRFKRVIEVTDVTPRLIDIKVDGSNSGLSYSISFKIN